MQPQILGSGFLALLIMAWGLAASAQTAPLRDTQGWSGPGWYITDTAKSPHAYILFEGPHAEQSKCVEVYDRLFSPIGTCRFLDAKPVEPPK